MHEHHAVDALVKQVIEKARLVNATKVTRVVIVMGELLGFDEGSVRLYFEQIAEGSVAEGAQLQFKSAKAGFQCKSCQTSFMRDKDNFSCPSCCSMQLIITSGKEFYIDSIDTESP